MFASPLSNQRSGAIKASPSLLKYLTQQTLALLMFLAFAVLASIGGKESKSADIAGIKSREAAPMSGQAATCSSQGPRLQTVRDDLSSSTTSRPN
jgi:hypothetical protein